MRFAEAGIAELLKVADTLLVIPNQNLFRVANEKTTFADAFGMADQVLYSGVACISDLIVKEGLINLDFADVLAVMREKGKAMMGRGEASGEKRVLTAAVAAISNPHRLDQPRAIVSRGHGQCPTHRWTHDRCRRRSPSGRMVRAYAAIGRRRHGPPLFAGAPADMAPLHDSGKAAGESGFCRLSSAGRSRRRSVASDSLRAGLRFGDRAPKFTVRSHNSPTGSSSPPLLEKSNAKPQQRSPILSLPAVRGR
jgi:hypothetical protein